MTEQVVERGRESEPGELIQEGIWRWMDHRRQIRAERPVVIKGRALPWEYSRQGLQKFYLHALLHLHPQRKAVAGLDDWQVFILRIAKHSGKHRHQGGLAIFILEGKGYTVVDGVKYDWEAGDLIVLPVKPDGCEHQHFNADPNKPSEWMAFIFNPYFAAMGNLVEQKEDAPEWTGPPLTTLHVT